MGGSKLGNQTITYGTLGTPSSTADPGSREGSLTWTDAQGNFWLFGVTLLVTPPTTTLMVVTAICGDSIQPPRSGRGWQGQTYHSSRGSTARWDRQLLQTDRVREAVRLVGPTAGVTSGFLAEKALIRRATVDTSTIFGSSIHLPASGLGWEAEAYCHRVRPPIPVSCRVSMAPRAPRRLPIYRAAAPMLSVGLIPAETSGYSAGVSTPST
jgi:hypothetical protein